MGAMSRATEIVVIHGCAVSIKGLSSVQVSELTRTATFTGDCDLVMRDTITEARPEGGT